MSSRNERVSKSSTSSSANNHNLKPQPMRVVYIHTHYVQTDAVSFKSVVQNLTGKDSTAAYSASTRPPPRREKINGSHGGYLGAGSHQSLLTRELSARDLFDVVPEELPAFEELQKLLSFD